MRTDNFEYLENQIFHWTPFIWKRFSKLGHW